jgi:hypothetical protein
MRNIVGPSHPRNVPAKSERPALRRVLMAGVVALACAGIAASAAAAPASGGHLPYFSLMNKRVAKSKLPFGMGFWFEGKHGSGFGAPVHGPVWFGAVERKGSTIVAAGTNHLVCESEEPKAGTGGAGGSCTGLKEARELELLSINSSCGGHASHFRLTGIVPNGITGLAIEKEDGTIGRTVPVVDNTVAFSVGHENITLKGVGDAAAEAFERQFRWAACAGRRGVPAASSTALPKRPILRAHSCPAGARRRRPGGSRPPARPSPRAPRSCGRRRARSARRSLGRSPRW